MDGQEDLGAATSLTNNAVAAASNDTATAISVEESLPPAVPAVYDATASDAKPLNLPCLFCGSCANDVLKYGEFICYQNADRFHYKCLLTASGLNQIYPVQKATIGLDENGVVNCRTREDLKRLGFSFTDITNECRRARRLLCKKCGRKGACNGCSDQKCKSSFHLPCAIEAGCFVLYSDCYPTYCPRHVQQGIDHYKLVFSTSKREMEAKRCMLCLEDLPSHFKHSRRFDFLQPTCCRRDDGAWYLHRQCAERQVHVAGQKYAKCPNCNQNTPYIEYLKRAGVFVLRKHPDYLFEFEDSSDDEADFEVIPAELLNPSSISSAESRGTDLGQPALAATSHVQQAPDSIESHSATGQGFAVVSAEAASSSSSAVARENVNTETVSTALERASSPDSDLAADLTDSSSNAHSLESSSFASSRSASVGSGRQSHSSSEYGEGNSAGIVSDDDFVVSATDHLHRLRARAYKTTAGRRRSSRLVRRPLLSPGQSCSESAEATVLGPHKRKLRQPMNTRSNDNGLNLPRKRVYEFSDDDDNENVEVVSSEEETVDATWNLSSSAKKTRSKTAAGNNRKRRALRSRRVVFNASRRKVPNYVYDQNIVSTDDQQRRIDTDDEYSDSSSSSDSCGDAGALPASVGRDHQQRVLHRRSSRIACVRKGLIERSKDADRLAERALPAYKRKLRSAALQANLLLNNITKHENDLEVEFKLPVGGEEDGRVAMFFDATAAFPPHVGTSNIVRQAETAEPRGRRSGRIMAPRKHAAGEEGQGCKRILRPRRARPLLLRHPDRASRYNMRETNKITNYAVDASDGDGNFTDDDLIEVVHVDSEKRVCEPACCSSSLALGLKMND